MKAEKLPQKKLVSNFDCKHVYLHSLLSRPSWPNCPHITEDRYDYIHNVLSLLNALEKNKFFCLLSDAYFIYTKEILVEVLSISQ